jgi:RNA polymerase sigma factor (sigma-70 family)
MEKWMDNLISMSATPESAALERERLERLDQAIAALPSVQRSIVQFKREGVKGKEIAARLGISQAYVSQLYHEAGELLRELNER